MKGSIMTINGMIEVDGPIGTELARLNDENLFLQKECDHLRRENEKLRMKVRSKFFLIGKYVSE